MRHTGTVVRGIRTPIIKSGDNLPELVLNSVKKAAKTEKFKLNNRNIIGKRRYLQSLFTYPKF